MPATRSQADAGVGGAEPEVVDLLEDAAAELSAESAAQVGDVKTTVEGRVVIRLRRHKGEVRRDELSASIALDDPMMLVPQAHTRHRRIPEFRNECRRQSGGD